MIKLSLTQQEKKVIIKAVDVQMNSLQQILQNSAPIDITLYCIQEEITPDQLNEMVENNLEQFFQVKQYPENLLKLDEDNLSIFRHILFNFVKQKKLKRAKNTVWKKLFTHEKIIQFYNAN